MRSAALEFYLKIAHKVAGSRQCFAGNAGPLPSPRGIDSTACTLWRPAAGRKRRTGCHQLPVEELPALTPYRDRRPEWPVTLDPAGRLKDRANFACVAWRRGLSATTLPSRRYYRFG